MPPPFLKLFPNSVSPLSPNDPAARRMKAAGWKPSANLDICNLRAFSSAYSLLPAIQYMPLRHTTGCGRAHRVRRRTDSSPHGMTQTGGLARRTPDLSLFTKSLRFAIEASLHLGSFLAVTASRNILKGVAVRPFRRTDALNQSIEIMELLSLTRVETTYRQERLHSVECYQLIRPVRLTMDCNQ